MTSDIKWRKREKRNDHHEKIFHITEFLNGFCFVFEKTCSSYPILFLHVGKSSIETLRSSRSHVLQNRFSVQFLNVRKRDLCWSLFLIKLET